MEMKDEKTRDLELQVKSLKQEKQKWKKQNSKLQDALEKTQSKLRNADARFWELESKSEANEGVVKTHRRRSDDEERLKRKQEKFDEYIYKQKQRVNARIDEVRRKEEGLSKKEEDVRRLLEETEEEKSLWSGKNKDKIEEYIYREKQRVNKKIDQLNAAEEKQKKKFVDFEQQVQIFDKEKEKSKQELKKEKMRVNQRIELFEKAKAKLKSKSEEITERERRLEVKMKKMENHGTQRDDLEQREALIEKKKQAMKIREREVAIERKIAAQKLLRLDASRGRLEMRKIQLGNREEEMSFLKKEIIKLKNQPCLMNDMKRNLDEKLWSCNETSQLFSGLMSFSEEESRNPFSTKKVL